MYDEKVILHSNRQDVYTNNKKALINGGYSVELSGSNGKKVIWEVVHDNFVEKVNEHAEKGLCLKKMNTSQ